MLADQGVQGGNPVQAFGQPAPCQPLAAVVDDLDVVMVLGPVISHEQHRASRSDSDTVKSVEEAAGDLMVKCSPQLNGARHPSSDFASSRPAGAQSAEGPLGSGPVSADPLAATGTEPAKEAR